MNYLDSDTEGSFSAASSSKEFIIATEPRASVSPSVLVKSHRQNRLNSADMQLSEVRISERMICEELAIFFAC